MRSALCFLPCSTKCWHINEVTENCVVVCNRGSEQRWKLSFLRAVYSSINIQQAILNLSSFSYSASKRLQLTFQFLETTMLSAPLWCSIQKTNLNSTDANSEAIKVRVFHQSTCSSILPVFSFLIPCPCFLFSFHLPSNSVSQDKISLPWPWRWNQKKDNRA